MHNKQKYKEILWNASGIPCFLVENDELLAMALMAMLLGMRCDEIYTLKANCLIVK